MESNNYPDSYRSKRWEGGETDTKLYKAVYVYNSVVSVEACGPFTRETATVATNGKMVYAILEASSLEDAYYQARKLVEGKATDFQERC